MTYKIETRQSPGESVIVFEGLLDEAALTDLASRLAKSVSTQLLLAEGTEVTQGAMARLRALPVAIHTDSPFLAAWLRSSPDAKGRCPSPREER